MSNLINSKNTTITLRAKGILGDTLTTFSADKTRFTVTDSGGRSYPVQSVVWAAGLGTMVITTPNFQGSTTLTILLDGTPVATHPPTLDVNLISPYMGKFISDNAIILTDGVVSGTNQTALSNLRGNNYNLTNKIGTALLTDFCPASESYRCPPSGPAIPLNVAHAGIGGRPYNASTGDPLQYGYQVTDANGGANLMYVEGSDWPMKTIMMAVWTQAGGPANNLFANGDILTIAANGSNNDPLKYTEVIRLRWDDVYPPFPYLQRNSSTITSQFPGPLAADRPIGQVFGAVSFFALRITTTDMPRHFILDTFYNNRKATSAQLDLGSFSGAAPQVRSVNNIPALGVLMGIPYSTQGKTALLDLAVYPDTKSDDFIFENMAAWGLANGATQWGPSQ